MQRNEGVIAAMSTATYTVSGMTCGHCVSAVSSELGKLDGVQDVRVDLATGRVELAVDRPVDEAEVAAAVTEAGYDLVPAH
jgi:copper chaperone